MLDLQSAYDISRTAILTLQSYEQFTEDEAVKVFKKSLGCNGKQAKKAWKRLKDKKSGGVREIEPGIYRLRKENEMDLENNKQLDEMVDVAQTAVEVLEDSDIKVDNGELV